MPNANLDTTEGPVAGIAYELGEFLLSRVPQGDAISVGIVQEFARQLVVNALVFAKKQHDYGPGNISSFGEVGVLVRVSDKIARLKNLQGRVAKN